MFPVKILVEKVKTIRWTEIKEVAIADGLTHKQTVERVKMLEFEGYALYGWVHPGLTVPAACKDLTRISHQ